jgi:hypothetical protein
MTDVEKAHIISAASFELGKVRLFFPFSFVPILLAAGC